jgi:hypothetical protein
MAYQEGRPHAFGRGGAEMAGGPATPLTDEGNRLEPRALEPWPGLRCRGGSAGADGRWEATREAVGSGPAGPGCAHRAGRSPDAVGDDAAAGALSHRTVAAIAVVVAIERLRRQFATLEPDDQEYVGQLLTDLVLDTARTVTA